MAQSERKPRRRRVIVWSVLVALLVVGAAGAFAAFLTYERATEIRSELAAAQKLVPAAMTSAGALDFAAAGVSLDEAAEHTSKAVELADDPLWRAASWIPWLGKNFVAIDQLALITDETLTAVRPLVDAGPSLVPANFAPVDGAVPIQPLLDAQPVVHTAAAELKALDARLAAVDVDGTLAELAAAKQVLTDALGQITSTIGAADTTLSIAPTLLGADAPQTYVIAFLNNAELRSLGGTALSFVELRVDGGRIELTRAVPAGFGNFLIGVPIVPVPEGFEEISPEGFGTFITNAGIRPSMQSAADVISANWEREFAVAPDAVLTMDVVALSYVLRATGAVTSGDWTIDSSNAVDVLLNQVLNAYDSGNLVLDNQRQDLVYADVVSQTFARVSTGQFDMATMIDSLGAAVDGRRLLLWSRDAEVEQALNDAGMDAGIPDRAGDDAIVGVYLNDNVGSKLNYYLDTAVRVDGVCEAGPASARVTTTLTSTLAPDAVAGLNPAVLGTYAREGLEPGVQRMYIYAYAPTGSTITAATVDGAPIELTPFSDAGHEVQVFRISLLPGATQQVAIDVTVPSDATSVTGRVTPTVRPTVIEPGTVC